MKTDDILYWTGAGKWHYPHFDHAACSPQVLLLQSEGRRQSTIPLADLCGRCFPGVAKRRHLRLVT